MRCQQDPRPPLWRELRGGQGQVFPQRHLGLHHLLLLEPHTAPNPSLNAPRRPQLGPDAGECLLEPERLGPWASEKLPVCSSGHRAAQARPGWGQVRTQDEWGSPVPTPC